MSSYPLLDQADEDALHKIRLLSVEERPFKRITKRILAPTSIISTSLQLPPTPPPDASTVGEQDDLAAKEAKKQEQLDEQRQFREDILLDFAAFESSIVRIQFLLTSNVKERERYAAENLRIQATAREVRDSTAELRLQLETAQKTLGRRKAYDDLAEKITNNRLLRPREDQHANLEKLNMEITELERESTEYAKTWAERRQQFGRIVEEGMNMRRLIRDEKEEVERREGMEDREDGEDGETGSQRGRISAIATPRPEAGGATPLHSGMDGDSGSLTVDGYLNPRAKSPQHVLGNVHEDDKIEVEDNEIEDGEDANLIEDGEVSVDEEEEFTPSYGRGMNNGEKSDVDLMDTA